jgi:hypothetical protein
MSDLANQIAALKQVLPSLPAKDMEFAASLIVQFGKKGALSPKQEPWVAKLVEKASAPAKPLDSLGSFAGVIDMFATAATHLKHPLITLDVAGQEVKLYVAGERASKPGWVNLVSKGGFSERQWFGRVSPEGEWEPSGKLDHEFGEQLVSLLIDLGLDPVKVVTESGQLSGRCCFCNSKLTDERSKAVGFGPDCADHYGLKAQWKAAAEKVAA